MTTKLPASIPTRGGLIVLATGLLPAVASAQSTPSPTPGQGGTDNLSGGELLIAALSLYLTLTVLLFIFSRFVGGKSAGTILGTAALLLLLSFIASAIAPFGLIILVLGVFWVMRSALGFSMLAALGATIIFTLVMAGIASLVT